MQPGDRAPVTTDLLHDYMDGLIDHYAPETVDVDLQDALAKARPPASGRTEKPA